LCLGIAFAMPLLRFASSPETTDFWSGPGLKRGRYSNLPHLQVKLKKA
jgi:hypothetical protein